MASRWALVRAGAGAGAEAEAEAEATEATGGRVGTETGSGCLAGTGTVASAGMAARPWAQDMVGVAGDASS